MLSRPYEKRKGGKEGKFKGGNTSIGEGGGKGGINGGVHAHMQR